MNFMIINVQVLNRLSARGHWNERTAICISRLDTVTFSDSRERIVINANETKRAKLRMNQKVKSFHSVENITRSIILNIIIKCII